MCADAATALSVRSSVDCAVDQRGYGMTYDTPSNITGYWDDYALLHEDAENGLGGATRIASP